MLVKSLLLCPSGRLENKKQESLLADVTYNTREKWLSCAAHLTNPELLLLLSLAGQLARNQVAFSVAFDAVTALLKAETAGRIARRRT